jgi:hypothetical protein
MPMALARHQFARAFAVALGEHSKSWGTDEIGLDSGLTGERVGLVPKLVWRVKLVAELRPGVMTETEVACIERD